MFGYLVAADCCCLLAIGYWLLAVGCRLLAVGCWLLAGGWWLVAGGWLLLAVGEVHVVSNVLSACGGKQITQNMMKCRGQLWGACLGVRFALEGAGNELS